MLDMVLISFEGKEYEILYDYTFSDSSPDQFKVYIKDRGLLKFAPEQFEFFYQPGKYPNWRLQPAFGDRFDTLRFEIIRALINKYKERYLY